MSASFAQRFGPWAVVAGAAEGIGRAFAEQHAMRGLGLLLVDRQAGPLEALGRALDGRPHLQVRTAVIDLVSHAGQGEDA